MCWMHLQGFVCDFGMWIAGIGGDGGTVIISEPVWTNGSRAGLRDTYRLLNHWKALNILFLD